MTRQERLRAYDREHARLSLLADAAMARCKAHPIPPPRNGLVPRGCTCFCNDPDWIAFMSLQSPVCNLCGGWEHCKPGCEALDRR